MELTHAIVVSGGLHPGFYEGCCTKYVLKLIARYFLS
jgi:hypothetical protein